MSVALMVALLTSASSFYARIRQDNQALNSNSLDANWEYVGPFWVPDAYRLALPTWEITEIGPRGAVEPPPRLGAAARAVIARHRNLVALALPAHRVDAADLDVIAGLAQFEFLLIDCASVEEGEEKALGRIRSLKELRLYNVKSTAKCPIAFEELTNLERLELIDSIVNEEWATSIANCRGLRRLRVTNSEFNDEAVTCLLPQTGLQVLDLSGTAITDDCVGAINQLKALKQVHLDRTAVTDEFFTKLGAASSFKVISLQNTKVTDAIITVLMRMPCGMAVDLRSTQVTKNGINTLKDARPDLQIEENASE